MEKEREEAREWGGRAIVTPPVCDGRISGAGGFCFLSFMWSAAPRIRGTSGYLYTLPVQHKAAQRCSADHQIIPTLAVCSRRTQKHETRAPLHITPLTLNPFKSRLFHGRWLFTSALRDLYTQISVDKCSICRPETRFWYQKHSGFVVHVDLLLLKWNPWTHQPQSADELSFY